MQFAGQIVTQLTQFGIRTDARDSTGRHTSACRGDSGGPLEFNGRLVGAVSRGRDCVGHTWFARVSTDQEWIQGAIARGGGVVNNRPPSVPQPRPPRIEPSVPQQRPPSFPSTGSSSRQQGACAGGRRPSNFYDSGCHRTARGISCTSPPPMPLGSMTRDQIQTMQRQPMETLRTGATDTCCLADSGHFYCRAPRGGFAPGTPGVASTSVIQPGRPPVHVPPSSVEQNGFPRQHRVRPGDTYFSLAREFYPRFETGAVARAIESHNGGVALVANRGQVIVLPRIVVR